MNNATSSSPLISPHEGRELALMLAGEKPLALFYAPVSEARVIPEVAFAPHVREGKIVRVERTISPKIDGAPTIRVVLFALPKERKRIIAALNIIEPVFSGARLSTREDDIAIGRLLGYAEEAIAHFVTLS